MPRKQPQLASLEKPVGPLADRMRPKTLDEVVGQEHLVGKSGILRTMLITDRVSSVILWGPPGVGKTTLAQIVSAYTKSRFVKFSAVTATLEDIRGVVREARELYAAFKQRTILFIDEIHRFNKLQQDAFLPTVEDGTIILIGATTENPSFEIVAPLLSRTKVFVLKPLEEKDLTKLLNRALTDKTRGLGSLELTLEQDAKELIVRAANGDTRRMLNVLEDAASLIAASPASPQSLSHVGEPACPVGRGGRRPGEVRNKEKSIVTKSLIEQLLQHQILRYDKKGDEHYNTVSAFIKSLRGSDPNAAIYYMARMLHSGEDPLFIARRMVVLASEDVGLSDPQALPLAIATMQAVDFIGMPEARITLAHCAAYLALAKKSNAAYMAIEDAMADVKETGNLPIPLHLLNAPTNLMKKLGYGKDYKYAHNYKKEELKNEQYLPDLVKDRKYLKNLDEN